MLNISDGKVAGFQNLSPDKLSFTRIKKYIVINDVIFEIIISKELHLFV